MGEDTDWGEFAKTVLMLESVIGFIILTGLVLHYGIAPAVEGLRNLISIPEYWRGVINTFIFLFLIMLFNETLKDIPRRRV